MGKAVLTDEMWNRILKGIGNKTKEIKTVPLRGNGIYFKVYVSYGTICVSAGDKKPKSEITVPRAIPRSEFDRMYSVYLDRKKGIPVSQIAQKITMNQVYIYAIFENFL